MCFSIYSPLEDKVLDAQTVFRCLLSAASFPGTIVSVGQVSPPWGQLDAAGAAIIQTLCDSNTNLYFSPSFADSALVESASFHTGVHFVGVESASFVIASADDTLDYSALDHGDEYTPERSATMVLQINAWEGGKPLALSGPGIKQTRTISPFLPESLVHYLSSSSKPSYPCGIDIILIKDDDLMSIPRTTKVTEEEK